MGLTSYLKNVWGALKAVPFRTDGGTGSFLNAMPWGASWTLYPNSNINFAQEAGPLTGSSLVMAAVNWAGTNLPEAPLQILRTTRDGAAPVPDHPLIKLFRRPNPYYSGPLLWKAGMLSWIIDGNMYFRKVRNAFGQIVELWYEPHFSIRPRWSQDGSEFIGYYEIFRNGLWYPIDKADVVHFRYGIDPYNDRLGLSPVASAYREIFTDSERARYSALTLKNGGVIPFLLTPKDADATVDPQEIKKEFEYRMQGDNIGRMMVLSGPMELQEVGATPDKLLVDKASVIPEERLAALIGIPAAVLGLGVGLAQTKVGATMRELREQAYENFVIPTQRLICPEIDVQLLPDFPGSAGLSSAFDLRSVRVLQDDQNALAERHAILYEKGIETRAEARAAFGLPVSPEDEIYVTEVSAAESPIEPDPTEEPARVKAARVVATLEEAHAWWLRSTPEDAHGLEAAEIVD